MSNLLPLNATTAERAIDDSIARASEVPVLIREVWNPQTCPSDVLPWLAWALSVDDWSDSWSEAQKREVIARSIDVHRYKGTIGAVKDAIGALFVGARVQEWFSQVPQGDPYTFRLLLESNQAGVDQAAIVKITEVLNSAKNLRSHLDRIDVSVRTQAGPYTAAVAGVGHEIRVTNYVWATAVANETTICM